MTQFVLIYRRAKDNAPTSFAQMQERIPKWQAWFTELAERGHLQDRGNPLGQTGRVVRSPVKKNTTDGPYAEKDLVIGYSLIEANDLDHACNIASGCPGLLEQDFSVEVRPVMGVG